MKRLRFMRAALRSPHETASVHEGKAATGVAAVEVLLHDLFDDRPEIAVLPLETALILRNEPLEMMK
jgi:hypothetical protein